MNLHTKYLTQNPYYKAGKYITGGDLYGFMLHSVGVGQPDPMVFWNIWNNPNYDNAGINGFIGEDDVYITAPCLETKGEVMRMPHGGKAYANNHYIGFEMCEPSTIKYTSGANFTIKNKAAAQAYVKKTYANAVALFAKLCSFHGKDPLAAGVIVSHNELGKKGLATGHVDPEHLWKGLGLSYTMDGFRKDVKAAMGGGSSTTSTTNTSNLYRVRKAWTDAKMQIGAFKNLNSAKDLAKSNPGYKVYDKSGKMVYNPANDKPKESSYRVKITANVLNVRAGAGTSYRVTMTVKKGGVYTIVDEKNGWGKLKSGVGWISLAYTERV